MSRLIAVNFLYAKVNYTILYFYLKQIGKNIS